MRLLWIGDACCHSGFATVTRQVLGGLQALGWDGQCLAINYFGDPHREAFPCYPASLRGDLYGIRRYREMVDRLKPDITVILHDPWNVVEYLRYKRDEKLVAYMPVDGLNLAVAPELAPLDLAVFYTQFGRQEARKGGYAGPAAVIPHGVDADLFRPLDRQACWQRIGMPIRDDGAFIVGCVNRNQPRKRLDLTISAFARWVQEAHLPPEVYLWLHCAPRDRGWDVEQLAGYYGIADRLLLTSRDMTSFTGVKVADMPAVYNSFHVQLNTSSGEGWGLPQLEGMACGIPQICGDWAALAEWAKGAAYLVPCTSTMATPERVNAIGGIPDEAGLVSALQHLYEDHQLRAEMGAWGRELAQRPAYRWSTIAAQFDQALRAVVAGEVIPHDTPPQG